MTTSGYSIFAFLLVLLVLAAATASEDLSGRWKISYEFNGSRMDALTEGSIASLSEKNSTVQGRATLGRRSDGFLIGCSENSSVQAAITFRHSPAFFVRLIGSSEDGELAGNFTASSSGGGFWWGKFRAIQLATAEGEVVNTEEGADPVDFPPLDEDLRPKPTEFVDPEAIFYAQQESGVREFFIISYRKNTILMCRNKPMIWQWWL